MNDYKMRKIMNLRDINISIKEIDDLDDIECEYSPTSLVSKSTTNLPRISSGMSDKEYNKTKRKYLIQKIKNKFKRIFRCCL